MYNFNHQVSRVTFLSLFFEALKNQDPVTQTQNVLHKMTATSIPHKIVVLCFFYFWKFITHFFHLKLDLDFQKTSYFVFKGQLRDISLFVVILKAIFWLVLKSCVKQRCHIKILAMGFRNYDCFNKLLARGRF